MASDRPSRFGFAAAENALIPYLERTRIAFSARETTFLYERGVPLMVACFRWALN
jgi:hypothetical protein